MKRIFMNRETGELFETFKAMKEDGNARYDLFDQSNCIPISEYYESIYEELETHKLFIYDSYHDNYVEI